MISDFADIEDLFLFTASQNDESDEVSMASADESIIENDRFLIWSDRLVNNHKPTLNIDSIRSYTQTPDELE